MFESTVDQDRQEHADARRHEPTWREQRRIGGAWVEQGAVDADEAGRWDE
jgi:hypothetical protein